MKKDAGLSSLRFFGNKETPGTCVLGDDPGGSYGESQILHTYQSFKHGKNPQ